MILKLIHRITATVRDLPRHEWKWVHKSFFVVFFIAALSFFLHFREVRIDHLEMGAEAEKYVLAQVGFDFGDPETTRILREESLRDIGIIYYFQDEEILKGERQIQHDLIHNSTWREQFPSLTFDDLMKANDAIRDTLLSVEFTDARTVEKLTLMGIDSSTFLPCEGDGCG